MAPESLFLNTLSFEFPKEPHFYFSKEDKEGVILTNLNTFYLRMFYLVVT